MSQPLDRTCSHKELGKVNREQGEFWVDNPFAITSVGENLSAYERNCLYLNLQGKRFMDGSFASDADLDSDSRSVVTADFDRDGDADLLVGSVGGGPLRLFLNEIPQGNRLELQLEGTTSNRSAIGAHVIAKIGDRQVVRSLFPANGFMGSSPPKLVIGTGADETIDRLIIRWPDGATEEFFSVPSRTTVAIRQGEGTFRIAAPEQAASPSPAAAAASEPIDVE